MALRAGYRGIKKYIADMLNAMSPGDGIATDKEIAAAISGVESVIGPVEDGDTASRAYTIGEHFIRDGKFCTVIQNISLGSTLTENTNYTSGDIASNFKTETQEISTETVQGITFSQLVKSAYRYGKVVFFRFRISVDAEVSFETATRFVAMPFKPVIGSLAYYPNNPNTHEQCPYSFIMNSNGQMTFLGTLNVGTYDIIGTYICE